MKPRNLVAAIIVGALAWAIIVSTLTGCSTPKWVAKAQNGRGITPAEAAASICTPKTDFNNLPRGFDISHDMMECW